MEEIVLSTRGKIIKRERCGGGSLRRVAEKIVKYAES